MIELVFTLDYEIYGNGTGSLRELVYEPAERLRSVFLKHGARFVVFPEVAELELIKSHGADPLIAAVEEQLRGLHRDGFEIGLHIHPWWYNARFVEGQWILDHSEYNLCVLPEDRIRAIVDRAIGHLRKVLGAPDHTPRGYRAGHLLFQPSRALAETLAAQGVKIDSSVYRGGLWRQHRLDYRRAPGDVPYWRFREDAAVPDPSGVLVEVPISTRMVPLWTLLTSKRVGLQRRGPSGRGAWEKVRDRFSDILRLKHPQKLDLGQMTGDEASRFVHRILAEDKARGGGPWPVVALLHTKDPIDIDAVQRILNLSETNALKVSTLAGIYQRIESQAKDSKGLR